MTDTCPRCLATTNPQTPADDAQRYVCRACGHTWTTSRIHHPEAPYATYDDPDAWEADDPPRHPYAPHPDDHSAPPDHDPWGDHQQDLIARILAAEAPTTVTITRADTEDNDR